MRTAWQSFRRLPAAAQAGAWLGLAAVYTAGLVALLGGGGDPAPADRPAAARPTATPATPTGIERAVRRAVTSTPAKVKLPEDVEEFLKPNAGPVKCRGASCAVVYSVAVPGRGRILEQQLKMLERIFHSSEVQRLTLSVTRRAPTGPNATTPPSGEEVVAGVLLLTTTCDTARNPGVDWSRKPGAEIMAALCTVEDADAGGQHGRGGAQKPS